MRQRTVSGLMTHTVVDVTPHTTFKEIVETLAEHDITAVPVVARPGWTVVEAARLMQEYQVKRLPVVSETEQVVGVVSRSDLMRVFLRRDHAIREENRYDILANTFRMAPTDITVHVVDGCVTSTSSTIPVLLVDGVVDVEEELTHTLDHSDRPAPAAH